MITFITGIPGAGKTALLTCLLLERMLDHGMEDYLSLKRELKVLNNNGFTQLDLPSQKHLCFSDYSVKFNKRYRSYTVDGFEIGLENPFFKTQYIPPYSWLFLDEAQVYYDSRFSKYMRDCVYHWYQFHRHNDFNIFLACQRLGNIDVNIRSIGQRFWVVDKLDVKENVYGQIEKMTWEIREFYSCDCAEGYMIAKERNEQNNLGCKIIKTTTLPVFNFYNSKSKRPAFYEGKYNRGFDYYTEDGYAFSLESFVEYNNSHYFTFPRGFLINAEYDKKILKELGEM